jgi:hypothetical protein
MVSSTEGEGAVKRILVLAAVLSFIGPALAANALWSGDTTGMPVFNRPVSLSSLSGVGTAVPFEVQPFWVTADGAYTFEVSGANNWDTYALAYSMSFDPGNALTNLINGDDDYTGAFTILPGSGPGIGASRIAPGDSSNYATYGLPLLANTQYYAVVTGFSNTSAGAYDAGIGDGPGDVNLGLVPEPGTLALTMIGAVALLRRR